MMPSTRRAGQAAERLERDKRSEHSEQAPIIAAQRKACTRLLQATLITSNCLAEESEPLTGRGSRMDMSAHTELVPDPRQRKYVQQFRRMRMTR